MGLLAVLFRLNIFYLVKRPMCKHSYYEILVDKGASDELHKKHSHMDMPLKRSLIN